MTTVIQSELAVVLIATKYDRHLVNETGVNFQAGAPGVAFQPIVIDGDIFPDITTCLNLGIMQAIEQKIPYVTWAHTDMLWEDPYWFHTLRNILEVYPEILKICASNSRDEIHPWRIGQEQSWLMRTKDFEENDWLWFNPKFRKCGGCEDYYQHYQILTRGKLIAITPDATVKHAGAQTRSKYDSNPDQLFNQQIFGQLTRYGQLIEVHQPGYFGILTPNREQAIDNVHPGLRALLKLDCPPLQSFTDREREFFLKQSV